MSNLLKQHQTYSVFVGHIPPNTKKYELHDLFKGCGEIVDVVILEGRDTSNFGFVRFTKSSAAFAAVSELNGWRIDGSKLTVEIAKETAEKLKQEEAGLSAAVSDACGPRKRNLPKPVGEKCLGTDYITDTMYWTRLQESCTALNLKQPNGKHLSINHLADDINKVKGERTSLFSSVHEASTSFDEISRKIMQRCRQKAEEGETLGKKNSAEFLCALRTIMKEINGVLETKSNESVEHMKDEDVEIIEQLELESSVVREVNEELEAERQTDSNEDIDEENQKLKNVERNSVRKRLSDASVQTVEEIDARITCNRKSLDDICYSDSDRDATDYVTSHVTCNSMSKNGFHHSAMDYHAGRKRDIPFMDPAIVDCHLSKLKEMEEVNNVIGDRENSHKNRIVEKDIYNILKLERSNVTFEESIPELEIVRTNSRESSLSEESNEGNVDDSGVESDSLGTSKGRRSFGVVENMLMGRPGFHEERNMLLDMPGVGHRRRLLKGSTSDPCLGHFDLDQYVMKNAGRGRGMFSVEFRNEIKRENIHTTSDNLSCSSISEGTGALGRGVFGALNNLKTPIVRGGLH